MFLGLPAPAKLNLFLHVVGRRADGYHELQSVFVPIDLFDLVDVELRHDGRIERSGDLASDVERDLCVRAGRALQAASGARLGASIHVDKRIPAGSGMGGGSSDAATTLLALNRLWALDWPRARLTDVGVRLGADVPFFLGAGPAFVEGIGERVTPLPPLAAGATVASADEPADASIQPPARLPEHGAVIWPQVSVSTAEIFGDASLTRNTKLTTISAFSAVRNRVAGAVPGDARQASSATKSSREFFGTNDLEPVVRRRVPEVAAALEHLATFGPARMTGSGSAVFSVFDSQDAARAALVGLPAGWSAWVVRLLKEHPLSAW